jgi:hypothetical protein
MIFMTSYILLLYKTKGKATLGLLFLTFFWLIVISLNIAYFNNRAFHLYANTFIAARDHHIAYTLPLPRATTLTGRHSVESASYYSRQSYTEVIDFYRNQLPDATIESIDVIDSSTQIVIYYQEVKYSVSVTPSGKANSFISIKVHP